MRAKTHHHAARASLGTLGARHAQGHAQRHACPGGLDVDAQALDMPREGAACNLGASLHAAQKSACVCAKVQGRGQTGIERAHRTGMSPLCAKLGQRGGCERPRSSVDKVLLTQGERLQIGDSTVFFDRDSTCSLTEIAPQVLSRVGFNSNHKHSTLPGKG